MRAERGPRVTVIDLYRLVATPRGLEPWELPRDERRNLSSAVAPDFWPGFAVTAGSERFDPIVILDYDPEWGARFETWRGRIASALGPTVVRIEHVGSTAVPGLPAKPIVDIQVSIANLFEEEKYVAQLEAIGVQLRSRDDLHRFFRPFANLPREVHVHVCAAGSGWERDHVLFRDYLRASADARARYAEAKREAAKVWSDDGWAYTDAKSEVILALKQEAEAWSATHWHDRTRSVE